MQVSGKEGAATVLLCEHCGVGKLSAYKPVPAVVLGTLVCPVCYKDGSGLVVHEVPVEALIKS